ncbi:hypothetical protein [Bartonella sp. AC134YNZD]|uniref:hypothetical protein n=1 Tax=Bartonella sp. AC134YNZD TaxID=3243446 RepID=UPI0035CFCDCA
MLPIRTLRLLLLSFYSSVNFIPPSHALVLPQDTGERSSRGGGCGGEGDAVCLF